MRTIALAPAAISVLLLSGCATTVEGSQLEAEIRSEFPEVTAVACPDLEGRTGNKVACDVTFGSFETKADAVVSYTNRSGVGYTLSLRDAPPAKG